MPSAASIVVKKKDGTTDITYDLLTASGGDGTMAVWRQDTGANSALPTGLRNRLEMMTKWNGPKTARQAKLSFVAPYAVQDTTTSLFSAKDRIVGEVFITIPQGIPATAIGEAVYQMLNLAASTLVKQSAEAGYAPT